MDHQVLGKPLKTSLQLLAVMFCYNIYIVMPKSSYIHCSCWFLFNKPKSTRYLPCYFCAYLKSVKIHKQVIQRSQMTLMRTPSFQQVYYCLHIMNNISYRT